MIPAVTFEAVEPESIMYKRGPVSVKLTGPGASFYRMMVGTYGEAEAAERIWWLTHKKSGESSHTIAAQSLEEGI